MRAISPKRAKINRERAKLLAPMKAKTEWCPRCGSTWGYKDGNETKGRGQGGSIVDPSNIVICCRSCNGWFEDNPIEAAWTGWKRSAKNERDPELADGEMRTVIGTIFIAATGEFVQ